MLFMESTFFSLTGGSGMSVQLIEEGKVVRRLDFQYPSWIQVVALHGLPYVESRESSQ